jgi:LPXTG-motif cell wall-anchored protein
LALTSLGVDASAYAAKLTEYDQVTSQGVNGTGYALLALDSKPYASENTDIRQQYIDYILGEQIAGGGWNWGFGDEADVDLTAMTIQALATYYDSNVDVSTAIDNALAVLQALQDKTTGGYFAWGVETAESAAQVIVALTALGKDPTGEDWTVNGDHNLITSLLSFKDATGGFKYADAVSQLTTEQAAYALVAYDRFENGLSPLFDLTDVDIDADAGDDTQPEVVNPQTGDLSLALPFAALLASVAGLLYMSRRRRVAKR